MTSTILRHLRTHARRITLTAVLLQLAAPTLAQTFSDVPANHFAFAHIEILAANDITAGCGGGNYCPDAPVTRAQMAVFLERSMRGGDYAPPRAAGNVFTDVSANDYAADFIEQLYADGITGGCGNDNYCPGSVVTRAQMAVFLERAKRGRNYTPPQASGTLFGDVGAGDFAASFIEQLARDQITSGCGGGNYCPRDAVSRAQMAVFLVRTFDLAGPPPDDGTDTDGDRLTDVQEARYGTSIVDRDTDGDGLEDGEEVFDLGFDSSNDNFQFNPAIADVPKVSIELTSLPDITISYGSSESTATTDSVNYTQGFSTSQTRSSSYTNSTSIEQTHQGSVSASPSSLGVSYSYSHTTTEEHSFSWEESQTVENHKAYEQGLENTSQAGINYTNGNLAVTVQITNYGDQTVEIELADLSLSAVQTDPADPTRFKSIATLSYVTDAGQAPTITVEPNMSSVDTLRFSSDLDLGTALQLLKDSSNLIVRPATWNFVDDQGRAFAHNATYYNAKDAMVVIDYGPNLQRELGRNIDNYLVATTASPNDAGITAAEALRTTLKIPFQTGRVPWDYDGDGVAEGFTEHGVTSVREADADHASSAYWMVFHERNDAVNDQLVKTLYDPTNGQPVDLESLVLKAGHVLHLVYIEDRDGDGVAAREEFLHGLLDDPAIAHSNDTDQDGLTDLDELRNSWIVNVVSQANPEREPYGVYSSPSNADLDDDDVDDATERDRGLDPTSSDTDEDGVRDDADFVHFGSAPIVDDLYVEMMWPDTIRVDGTIAATGDNFIALTRIDWGDGTEPHRQTQTGGNSTTRVPNVEHVYDNPGEYLMSLTIEDSAQNRIEKTARIVIEAPVDMGRGLGFDSGYRLNGHIREVVDINNDGHSDVIAFANRVIIVWLGTESGFDTADSTWSSEWGAQQGYPDVDRDPRLLADINGDGLLDIVGVRSDNSQVRYSLQTEDGSFAASQLWIDDLGWTAYSDSIYIADVDGNLRPDLIHAASYDDQIRVYLALNDNLDLSNPILTDVFEENAGETRGLWRDNPTFVSDIDGDGCADVTHFGGVGTYYMRSRCDGSFDELTEIVREYGGEIGWRNDRHVRLVTDVDGDGRDDIVGFGQNEVTVVTNESTPGNIRFADAPVHWSDQWVNGNGGWATNRWASGEQRYGINPRYIADVDGDGDKDIIGFSNYGACMGINRLAETGQYSPTDTTNCIAPFDLSSTEWNHDYGSSREYFPRRIGDINNDGRMDVLGFSREHVVYQFGPLIEQFR